MSTIGAESAICHSESGATYDSPVDSDRDKTPRIRGRVIRFRVVLWAFVAVMLLSFGIAALAGNDWAGSAVLLTFAAIAALVAYRTGSERRGHSVGTALLSRRHPEI